MHPNYVALGASLLIFTTVASLWWYFDPQPVISPLSQLTTTKQTHINWNNYYEQKGIKDQSQDNSFSDLLALSPPNILGATTKPDLPELEKSSYTIAVLGDSMVDTLGKTVPHLQHELKKLYPEVEFKLLNYGTGAVDIEKGAAFLRDDHNYLGTDRPALLATNPDFIVIESFAYNHWDNTKPDLDRHWLAIAKTIDAIHSYGPGIKIILASTIAPYCPTYTDGSASLPPGRKQAQCETVKVYLNNMVNFAQGEGHFLADAFHASLEDGEGKPEYINSDDHIHPSDQGKVLFAQKVSQAVLGAFTQEAEEKE